jgi:hypothetical protein
MTRTHATDIPICQTLNDHTQDSDVQICDAIMMNMGNAFFEKLVAPRELGLVSQCTCAAMY